MASKLLLLGRLSRSVKLSLQFPSSKSYSLVYGYRLLPLKASQILGLLENIHLPPSTPRSYCSSSLNVEGPTSIDYRSILQEDEFHRLADNTIHDLQEKVEVYGDSVEVDGFDIDYGNDVLTVKLGVLGTYVLNKQTPNRQLWLSSPIRRRPMDVISVCSGPSRFDWDQEAKAWIYRRNKANLCKVLEDELRQLCGKPIVLS